MYATFFEVEVPGSLYGVMVGKFKKNVGKFQIKRARLCPPKRRLQNDNLEGIQIQKSLALGKPLGT